MIILGHQLPALPPNGWRIAKLASWSGRDLIDDWLRGLPIGQRKAVKVELETMLRFLRRTKAELWNRPQFDWIQGDKYQGIGEIILDCNGIPYRPLGCFGREADEFTLLLGTRKDRKRKGLVQWNPQNALDTAVKSRKELLAGLRTANAYEL